MRRVFADTFYWVALINRKDQWRGHALQVSRSLINVPLVTTDEILTEILNYFSEAGEKLRRQAVENVRAILLNQNVEIISCTHETVLAAIDLYERRPDKGYSLTDCISMISMKSLGLDEIRTHDDHFWQEGFNILL